MVIPFEQDLRNDLAPSNNPCDTTKNCLSEPNVSIAVSGDVSDSDSLSVDGKVVSTRRRRIVRMVFDFVIPNVSGGASLKHTNEVNVLDGLPRKRKAVSQKGKDGDLIMKEAGVQLCQEP